MRFLQPINFLTNTNRINNYLPGNTYDILTEYYKYTIYLERKSDLFQLNASKKLKDKSIKCCFIEIKTRQKPKKSQVFFIKLNFTKTILNEMEYCKKFKYFLLKSLWKYFYNAFWLLPNHE